jgi:hypothetical protein
MTTRRYYPLYASLHQFRRPVRHAGWPYGANWIDADAKATLVFQLPAAREVLRGGAQQLDFGETGGVRGCHLRDEPGCEDDDYDEEGWRPLDVDETILTLTRTIDTPGAIGGHAKRERRTPHIARDRALTPTPA